MEKIISYGNKLENDVESTRRKKEKINKRKRRKEKEEKG